MALTFSVCSASSSSCISTMLASIRLYFSLSCSSSRCVAASWLCRDNCEGDRRGRYVKSDCMNGITRSLSKKSVWGYRAWCFSSTCKLAVWDVCFFHNYSCRSSCPYLDLCLANACSGISQRKLVLIENDQWLSAAWIILLENITLWMLEMKPLI